jgi:hypothetical protein
MKRVFVILIAILLLAACQPTPDHDFIVQKDTERLVETVELKNANEDVSIEPADMPDNPLVKMDERYAFDFVNDNGRLHIHADADVYVPETGKVPMARVKGDYFTDAFAKKLFDKIYQGETAYIRTNETRRLTKSELAEMIVYYQDLVDTGRTEDKMMDEEEAIECINEWKEEYKTAPDEAEEIKPVVSDGTMLLRNVTDDSPYALFQHVQYYELWTRGELGELQICRSAETDLSIQDHMVYHRDPLEEGDFRWISYNESIDSGRKLDLNKPFDCHVCSTEDHTCAYGQTISPYDATELCRSFLEDLDVTDIVPISPIDTYVTKNTDGSVDDCIYFIDFVRTVYGTPVAYLTQCESYMFEQTEIPWDYETIRFLVDSKGINSLTWQYPVQVTKLISSDAAVLTLEQAENIFENMSVIIYDAQTYHNDKPIYIDVLISRVELSLVRVREKNAPGRTGLYIPAWVFYGKAVSNYREPVMQEMIDKRMTGVILAVNAIDGSIIDLGHGY